MDLVPATVSLDADPIKIEPLVVPAMATEALALRPLNDPDALALVPLNVEGLSF